jgi:hypothetical protein
VKFFSKKSKPESLKTLNEREIQERLYGKYHADSPPKVTISKSASTATLTRPEIKSRLEPSFSSPPSQKAVSFRFSVPGIKFLKNFPWKFSGLVLGSLVGAIFLLQILSSWMDTLKKESVSIRVQKSAVTSASTSAPKTANASIPAAKPLEEVLLAKPVLSVSEPKPPALKAVETPKKKYYAVQVCTYFQESDARELTQKLKGLNFTPFYERVTSSQGTLHYLVFLGKQETYSAAQSQLESFKKSSEFQSFQDSFIRSI